MRFRVDGIKKLDHRSRKCCLEGLQTNLLIRLPARLHISAVISRLYKLINLRRNQIHVLNSFRVQFTRKPAYKFLQFGRILKYSPPTTTILISL
ncbi:hypothetical protein L798_04371 [Zootermopsis nevadensis]|uniref:Uncharacterized protein n=1 Tax=Zootermopsis nevadensis TaxID=136037 RepID=A0A067RAE6_ZOONE|nr:hypothetical protein L798_04371 [Zootermopsis nevadensis]